MSKGTSLATHVNNYTKLLSDLANMDKKVTDDYNAIILLGSLSDEEYDTFVFMLLNDRSSIIYNERDCPKLKEKENSKKNGSKANEVNVARDDDSDDLCFSLLITPEVNHVDASNWMLDSGASYHVTPRRDWFASFERLDGGVVVMGNDQSCGIYRIGTIRIQMHDGVVRELNEVRFVPQLKMNLISVRALEAKGFKMTFENAVAKVTKGSLVVMNRVRSRNLYYLKGSTEIGQLDLAISEANESRLLHYRLGHTGKSHCRLCTSRGY
ncbi:uncharacterized protein A4U43_C01F31260 [Asparagus officinalis]|uniref:Retrovirus-related Pol polyprotein from transposon TNT 1-94-like beta-barrel domain-containing protein n=1 Tax=Asparagus officinalis TaxID=4686 RepID=A0A5P1FTT4_ASPOF|nr:uncharacterized protein A4U43_C01F31260 [Asparagus officinalis]